VLVSELGNETFRPVSLEQLAKIRDWWVEGQRAWLLDEKIDKISGRAKSYGKVKDNEILTAYWERLARRFALGGLGAILGLLPFHVFLAPTLGKDGDFSIALGTAIYGIPFALGGLCKVYAEVKAFRAQAQRYRRNGLVFNLAGKRLDTALASGDVPAVQTLLFETGKAALAENADWLLIHRERPVSVPIG
jgi:hypothetical protein